MYVAPKAQWRKKYAAGTTATTAASSADHDTNGERKSCEVMQLFDAFNVMLPDPCPDLPKGALSVKATDYSLPEAAPIDQPMLAGAVLWSDPKLPSDSDSGVN